MISEPHQVGSSPRPKYPSFCIECGKKEVCPEHVREAVERNHDGQIYEYMVEDLPVLKCRACGEVYYTEESDDRMVAELRRHLGLLTPERIRANLEALHLTQKGAAAGLGIAAETLSRWLAGGMVQSRAMDNLLRAFFGSAAVRDGVDERQAAAEVRGADCGGGVREGEETGDFKHIAPSSGGRG